VTLRFFSWPATLQPLALVMSPKQGLRQLKPVIMFQFLNTFMTKGMYIYFGRKDKVYVISKQLFVNVFGICVKGYVEDPKG
jgi:hypothetical protein